MAIFFLYRTVMDAREVCIIITGAHKVRKNNQAIPLLSLTHHVSSPLLFPSVLKKV